MEKIRGKSLKEWKYYSDKDKANIPIRTQKYIIVLEERIEQLNLTDVSQQRELLNALADDFNDSTDTYVGQKTIEKTLCINNK